MLSVYKVKLEQNSQFEIHILKRFNDLFILQQKISNTLFFAQYKIYGFELVRTKSLPFSRSFIF